MAGANDAYDRYNREVKAWAKATQRSGRAALPSDTGELRRSFKPKVYTDRYSLAAEAIRFTFARQGIFVDQGVGKGRPVGSAAANKYKTNVLGRTIDNKFPALERIIDQHYAKGVADAISANLPDKIIFKSK